MTESLLERTLKSALLAGAGFAILAGTAYAQAPAAEPVEETTAAAAGTGSEEVTVTGSRIRKQDYVSNSPLQTVTGDSLREIGVATVETYLNSLPQFSPALSKSNNNPQGGGAATLDLRQLGASRGLVLMNGRRLVPGFSGGAVDVSSLPPALIERVEIITGGASAVYGSDAISGVVNFILKNNFTGVETTAQFGTTEFGDGNEVNLSTTMGGKFEDDKGHAVLSIGYTQRDRLGQGAREFSQRALTCVQPQGSDPVGVYLPGLYCILAGSPSTPDGTLLSLPITAAQVEALQTQVNNYFALPANGGAAPGTVVVNNSLVPGGWIGFNPDGTLFGTGGSLGNSLGQTVTNYRGPHTTYDPTSYSYNFNPDNELLLGMERYNIYSKVQYNITDSITAWADVLFTQYEAATALAPAPTTIGGVNASTAPADFRNLLIAAGIDPSTINLNVVRRFNELGPRAGNFSTTSWQISGGLEGAFEGPAAGSSWAWDLTASYGKYAQEVYFRGYASISRARAAGAGCPAGSPTAINGQACVPANLFGAGSLSPAAIRYIEYPYFDNQYIEQKNIIGNLTGDLFELPYGWVSMAVGLEYRFQSYARVADQSLPSGDVGGANTAAPFRGSFDVYEAYGEVIVPILKDMEFVHDLSLEAGFRYSDYNTAAGTTETYKYGISYAPVEWLRFRAQKQAAIRAPSLGNLFQARNEGFPGISGVVIRNVAVDPCSSDSPDRNGPNATQVRALCAAQAAAAGSATFVSPTSGQYRIFSGGNPNLTPEFADTLTVGAVFQADPSWSPWLGGLQLTLDYWKIELEDGVGSVGIATILSRCYDPVSNPTFSASNAFCQQINRDPTSGLLNSTSTGFVNTAFANLAEINLAGWDFSLAWAADLEDLGVGENSGRLGLLFQGTKFDKYEVVALPGNDPSDFVGTTGDGTPSNGTLPEWKTTTILSYMIDDFSISWRWVYIDGVEAPSGLVGTPNGPRPAVDTIPAYNYHYLNARYAITENVEIFGGVDNLFDKKPPYFTAGFQYGTDPGTYDVIGRYYYFGVTTRF